MTDASTFDPSPIIALELGLAEEKVRATIALFDQGATVPFVARYRKEATGGLDEVQIRIIEERRTYLVELDERRRAVLAEIEKQGKLTPALAKAIHAVATKAELEDLYLPFKPKRRTRATIARERGLEPLATLMLGQGPSGDPRTDAARFVDAAKEVPDLEAALAGARDICAETIADKPEVRRLVRQTMTERGALEVKKTKDFEGKTTKFDTYADYVEPVAKIPSHRFLAIRRGETEKVLTAGIAVDTEELLRTLARTVGVAPKSPWAGELSRALGDAYKRLLATTAEIDVRVELKMAADRDAVGVFAQNLRELLLAAPYGTKVVLGIDPGQRTGCKCAVVDATGKLLQNDTIYLVQGDEAEKRGKKTLLALVEKHGVAAVAVGNGTHGRETESFVKSTLAEAGVSGVLTVAVSESGASVYSASDVARDEFPDLDLTVRGAISIARRLQDPLAELVKVDPKSIGVGQYQHDVSSVLLEKKLDEVVESCVNKVGVELNTASAALLSRVSGIGSTLAKKIVAHRDQRGRFASRRALLEVPGLGPKTFEQAAGFLRIRGGAHPLDASAVHPERYGLVEEMARDLGVPVASLIGSAKEIARLDRARYQRGDVGSFTIDDILAELDKPGRDPRATFEPPKFRDDVRSLADLQPGMRLEGVVTNVTAFGAFIDVGVHQDGLCHVSQLADRFVKDPSEVVRVGDRIQVTVLEVDHDRKRIGLSARSGARPTQGQGAEQQRGNQGGGQRGGGQHGGRRSGGQRGDNDQPQRPREQPKFSHNPFAVLKK